MLAQSNAVNTDDLSPKPCNMNKDAVMAFAEKVAEKVRYFDDLSLERVVRSLRGEIQPLTMQELLSGVDGSIKVEGIGNFVIHTSPMANEPRNRFTIAHELGHYFLHSPNNAGHRLEAHRYESGRAEWEANWFASAFLMPAKRFTDAFNRNGKRLVDVAKQFNVSLEAAEYRANYLNLIQ